MSDELLSDMIEQWPAGGMLPEKYIYRWVEKAREYELRIVRLEALAAAVRQDLIHMGQRLDPEKWNTVMVLVKDPRTGERLFQVVGRSTDD